MNIYRHIFSATCPNNGQVIDYELRIKAGHVIMAEAIVEQCAEAAKLGKPYHENIADYLADKFCGRQRLTAFHHGVYIETRRG